MKNYPWSQGRLARVAALQAAADLLADAAEDPSVFDGDALQDWEVKAALKHLDRLAVRMQKEADQLAGVRSPSAAFCSRPH